MKRFIILLSAFTLFLNMSAQETSTAKAQEETKEQPSATVEKIKLATQLAKYGYENASVLSLIQAANLFSSLGEKELGAESVELGEEPTDSKEEKISFKVDDLLAEAKDLADGDPTYLALINKIESSSTRGVVGGIRTGVYKLPARSSHTFRYTFYANSKAAVVVSGDGDTDLDLYIYDENGHMITSDTDYSDDCVCVWRPAWTGSFTIKVVNRGNVYNKYFISIE